MRRSRTSLEVVAEGLRVPEGPALAIDGSIVFTEQTGGCISRLADGIATQVAYTGGAPNSCVVGSAGEMYVCQNGGKVGTWRSSDPRTPGIYVVPVGGGPVELVTDSVLDRPLVAPNDLVFDPDGRLLFTDPAQAFRPEAPVDAGSIYGLGHRRAEDLVIADVGGVYCNGIALGVEWELMWAESYTRRIQVLSHGLPVRTLSTLPEGHTPDGMAVAADGRIYVASCESHCIDVIAPNGRLEESVFLDERANPTNCCFDGNDLIVTDFGMDFAEVEGAGRLWRVKTNATGLRPRQAPGIGGDSR